MRSDLRQNALRCGESTSNINLPSIAGAGGLICLVPESAPTPRTESEAECANERVAVELCCIGELLGRKFHTCHGTTHHFRDQSKILRSNLPEVNEDWDGDQFKVFLFA